VTIIQNWIRARARFVMYNACGVQEVVLINALSAIMIHSYIKSSVYIHALLNYITRIPQIVHVLLAISLVCNAQAPITIIALNVPMGNILI
jgi:hypothetical protein